jgi:MFS family permease
VLLQFSSNFAQGPFQGYIPDLVPARQVATASALVGVMSILGVVGGTLIVSAGYALGDFVIPTIILGVVELATAIGTLLWVEDGRTPRHRGDRSWLSIARETWGLDVFRHRGFIWLVASRLCVLAGISVLSKLAVLYLERSLLMTDAEKGFWVPATNGLVALVIVITAWPAARVSDRFGRKRVIYASCTLGGIGTAIVAIAPHVLVAELGVILIATAAGSFLAVDWALMTDLIPKESSGRFMGMSNVATASAGPLSLLTGGTLMDFVGGAEEGPAGPRAAFALAVLFYVLGAAFLRPVPEPARDTSDDQLETRGGPGSSGTPPPGPSSSTASIPSPPA